jgi:hypothetical protein
MKRGAHDPDGWTSRDVYTHLARWMDLSNRHLVAELDGQSFQPEPGTDDEISARWKKEHEAMNGACSLLRCLRCDPPMDFRYANCGDARCCVLSIGVLAGPWRYQ